MQAPRPDQRAADSFTQSESPFTQSQPPSDRAISTDAEADRWDAVTRRDPSADGRFVYSVRTTGVYCRPSCPSRPARRENVAFHGTCAEAERAGFRACKRCRPDAASQAERHAHAIARACGLIATAEGVPSLDALAKAAGLSPYHFHRIFKAATGVTPRAYASQQRESRVASGLQGAETITHALYDAGFNASSRFYASAKARFGMTPTAYRDGGAGMTIRFALGACSLGSILVAATEKGVCTISIGDDPDVLARELQDRFAKAEIVGADAAFEATVAQVVGFVERPGQALDLPLDISGTAFQQRVWEALRSIPVGVTATYTEVAAAAGVPRAVRAVGSACRANPIAIAIPCHRVVRADGSCSGYRWGVERKRALIDREAKARADGSDEPGDPAPFQGQAATTRGAAQR